MGYGTAGCRYGSVLITTCMLKIDIYLIVPWNSWILCKCEYLYCIILLYY